MPNTESRVTGRKYPSLLQTRVSTETADKFKALAEMQGISEAELLRGIVEQQLSETNMEKVADELRQAFEARLSKITGTKKKSG